jgi:hypothetical protein
MAPATMLKINSTTCTAVFASSTRKARCGG